MTQFQEKVYEVVKKIPRGKVMTYGQVARLAGHPGAARAVGMVMKNNPYTPIVPCHRVVGAGGRLVGYSGEGGVVKKKEMLIKEGVKFVGEKVERESYCMVNDDLL